MIADLRCAFKAVLLLASMGVAPVSMAVAEEIDLLSPPPRADDLAAWRLFSAADEGAFSDTWSVNDAGVLICKGSPLGYLYTREHYQDFVLKLQWRIPADASPYRGGVLIRMTGEHKIWPKSLEAQINHPDAGDFWGLDGFRFTGPEDRLQSLEHSQFGVLTHLAKTAAVERDLGQWNDYEIRAEGPVVTLRINGREVNRATRCETAAGPICLTAEGNEIHFRNIRLIPLSPQ